MRLFVILLTALLCLGAPVRAEEEHMLPDIVQKLSHAPLQKVGTGTYRKYGFSVYHASLWAPGGVWDATKPYALELRYTRGVSKDTLVDTVMDDIRGQKVADDDTLDQWHKILYEAMPGVEDGDVIIGVAVPGKESILFYNGQKLTSIKDQNFSRAFFNIWLGDGADQDLHAKLLGQER